MAFLIKIFLDSFKLHHKPIAFGYFRLKMNPLNTGYDEMFKLMDDNLNC